jgi:hypothetical protein
MGRPLIASGASHIGWARNKRTQLAAHALAGRNQEETIMAKTLSKFTISSEGEGYVLHVETDDGQILDISATYEQLDLISEAIEERLDEDEEDMLAVEGEA